MYILSNAIRCISRSKGRNILIGIIVLVIATSCCIGLSIRQAAESAKEDALENLSVTATISFDRQSMMSDMRGNKGNGDVTENYGGRPSFDREQFQKEMGEASALTLEEYELYAGADSVKDFYYTATVSLNGSNGFVPVSTDSSDEANTDKSDAVSGNMFGGAIPQGGGQGGFKMGMTQSDFTVVGCSSDLAMTSFIDGTAEITDGMVFDEGTFEYDCIISEELSVYNSVATGDEIELSNPNNEDEVYILNVVGIYSDSSANENSFSPMGFSSGDPANKIYMSYNALESIVNVSEDCSQTITDSDTGREFETALSSSLSATYVFADADAYYLFDEQARQLGLDESYIIFSSDISNFENSLTPLKTLSTMAGWFLLVILIIGAVILVVLNIFSVRERKYEIGVLTAMGMKKHKVAMQFLTELFVVTLVAVIIGVIIGGVCAVPVTNELLENQIASQQNNSDRVEESFGRPGAMHSFNNKENVPDKPQNGFMSDMFRPDGGVADYITEINSAMNLKVVLQMFLIALALTLVSGAASMLFIMRYEPLRILANRD